MVIPPMELSAEWMMSDFEHNIQLSWVSIFPDVEARGATFTMQRYLQKLF